jgi:hypothetical protein
MFALFSRRRFRWRIAWVPVTSREEDPPIPTANHLLSLLSVL